MFSFQAAVQENKVTIMWCIFKAKFNLDELPMYMVGKQIYNLAAMIPSLDLMVFSSLGGG